MTKIKWIILSIGVGIILGAIMHFDFTVIELFTCML